MLNFRELSRAAQQVMRELRDARLDKVSQSAPTCVALRFSGGAEQAPRARTLLLLSCHPKHARVSAPAKAPKAAPRPLALCSWLRAHLEGGRLREARVEGGDRSLRLRIETPAGHYTLLLSLLGARSNLYVLDEGERIRASARPLGETRRDLALGEPWKAPQSPPPPPGEDRFAEVPDAQLLEAVEAHYAAQEAKSDEAELARRIARVLKKRSKALERKIRLLEGDIEAGAEAVELERFGELLKANLRELKPGMREVRLKDFESGAPLRVPLDEKLSPQKNMERYFRRAQRAVRSKARAESEIVTQRERLAELTLLTQRAEAATPEQLREMAAGPELARLLERHFPAAGPRAGGGSGDRPARKVWKVGGRELPTRLVPKRYRTEAGLEVWVGKNDEGNDVLTTRLAKGNDLFFHLEGDPGSHVVLRTGGAAPPPQEALLDAAELAVHFSKARNAGRSQVHIASIKDISKPKGAKPGLVYVHRGRSLNLKRSSARLERILAARIDD